MHVYKGVTQSCHDVTMIDYIEIYKVNKFNNSTEQTPNTVMDPVMNSQNAEKNAMHYPQHF